MGTGTDVCGSSGGAFSLRKMNPPSIPAPYKKSLINITKYHTQIHNTQEPNNTVQNEHIRFTLFFRHVPKTAYAEAETHSTKVTPRKQNIRKILCLKFFFLSVTVRLSAVVLFFGMKTLNASISTRRYRYRYPCYVTLTWYGMFMQKRREEIECFKSRKEP
jgi:hypothetical protein